jgi:hypothetical protein
MFSFVKNRVCTIIILGIGALVKVKNRGMLIILRGSMFEAENRFFEENRETFREKYLGKRVVIVKDRILGVYDTDSEAIAETSKEMELGTFCVKYIPVNPAEEHHRLLTFL